MAQKRRQGPHKNPGLQGNPHNKLPETLTHQPL